LTPQTHRETVRRARDRGRRLEADEQMGRDLLQIPRDREEERRRDVVERLGKPFDVFRIVRHHLGEQRQRDGGIGSTAPFGSAVVPEV
jgi:hypothetical protein